MHPLASGSARHLVTYIQSPWQSRGQNRDFVVYIFQYAQNITIPYTKPSPGGTVDDNDTNQVERRTQDFDHV